MMENNSFPYQPPPQPPPPRHEAREDAEVTALIEIHRMGGVCEQHRTTIWKELDGIKNLQAKMLGAILVLSFLGPLVAQWLFKHFGG